MTYKDLTLMQRIGLKGMIEKLPELRPFKAVWLLWNFKVAVNAFLSDEPYNILTPTP
jgi:hypothetical protein